MISASEAESLGHSVTVAVSQCLMTVRLNVVTSF
jgi:hypothetical protein